MKLRHYFNHIIFFSLLMLVAFPAVAVSDKDMEEAKVIAAKLYLRWSNNGSGYLDDLSASSMADLESKLKSQEKENLKDFKKVNIPADYASWDKERFVQFWGTTFFTSPALSADGKRAKDRVKAKVSALNVSAPSASKKEEPKTEEPKAEETKPDEKKDEAQNGNTAAEEGITIPEPQEVMMRQEEAVVDSLGMLQAEEESAALSKHAEKAKNNTWIYVAILIVLVILVVWLMVYAANMMKKQGGSLSSASSEGDKKLKKEISVLEAENNRLRSEVSQLKSQIDELKTSAARMRSKYSEQKKPETTVETAVPKENIRQSEREVIRESAKPQPKVINEIFLGRANPKGLFVRGDRRPNPGYTVYRLDTKDGIVGTFRFVDTPEALTLVLSNPLHFLAGGCVSENFEEAENATRILTDAPGTAILENGCWKVLRKSKIRFE